MQAFAQIERLQEEIDALEYELRTMQKENDELWRENLSLRDQISDHYEYN